MKAFVQLSEGHFPPKKPNCPANSLGGLLVWSKEGILLLIL